jgi:hypothetical protein
MLAANELVECIAICSVAHKNIYQKPTNALGFMDL